MTATEFRCLIVDKRDAQATAHVSTLPIERLPHGDVTISVKYSSLNYKDALACEGHPGVVKHYPHIPGIDAAGIVVASRSEGYKPGDSVLVTGYDFGQGQWGGWSAMACVPAAWLIPLPCGLTLREAMVLGTAGFTAAQCVLALRRNEIHPDAGELVVTGASGGVGSIAIQILSKLGYQTVAVTGKNDQHEQLLKLGAARVLERAAILDDSTRPMLSARWAGGVDTVGGSYLNSLLRATRYGGCVTACGLVAGAELDMTVYPFLLRGITLCGIASADCPQPRRLEIWDLLAGDWKPNVPDEYVVETVLEDLPTYVERMKAGGISGRVIVRMES